MALTEFTIKNAKAGAKIVKLSDGSGVQLWITPDGAKRWRKGTGSTALKRHSPSAFTPTLVCGMRETPAKPRNAS
jgi:hypothetical protein